MINLDRYRHIPFKEKGRDFDGVDCWGMVYLIYKHELGIIIPTFSAEYEHSHDVDFDAVKGDTRLFVGWNALKKPEENCVCLFSICGNFHVGISLDKKARDMFHIMKGRLASIEDTKSVLWRRTFRGWWRYAG